MSLRAQHHSSRSVLGRQQRQATSMSFSVSSSGDLRDPSASPFLRHQPIVDLLMLAVMWWDPSLVHIVSTTEGNGTLATAGGGHGVVAGSRGGEEEEGHWVMLHCTKELFEYRDGAAAAFCQQVAEEFPAFAIGLEGGGVGSGGVSDLRCEHHNSQRFQTHIHIFLPLTWGPLPSEGTTPDTPSHRESTTTDLWGCGAGAGWGLAPTTSGGWSGGKKKGPTILGAAALRHFEHKLALHALLRRRGGAVKSAVTLLLESATLGFERKSFRAAEDNSVTGNEALFLNATAAATACTTAVQSIAATQTQDGSSESSVHDVARVVALLNPDHQGLLAETPRGLNDKTMRIKVAGSGDGRLELARCVLDYVMRTDKDPQSLQEDTELVAAPMRGKKKTQKKQANSFNLFASLGVATTPLLGKQQAEVFEDEGDVVLVLRPPPPQQQQQQQPPPQSPFLEPLERQPASSLDPGGLSLGDAGEGNSHHPLLEAPPSSNSNSSRKFHVPLGELCGNTASNSGPLAKKDTNNNMHASSSCGVMAESQLYSSSEKTYGQHPQWQNLLFILSRSGVGTGDDEFVDLVGMALKNLVLENPSWFSQDLGEKGLHQMRIGGAGGRNLGARGRAAMMSERPPPLLLHSSSIANSIITMVATRPALYHEVLEAVLASQPAASTATSEKADDGGSIRQQQLQLGPTTRGDRVLQQPPHQPLPLPRPQEMAQLKSLLQNLLLAAPAA